MNELSSKTCEPCQGGIPPLKREQFEEHLDKLDNWKVIDEDTKIQKEFEFGDFKEALNFVNQVGEIAEREGHHPNILLHDYKKVTITLYTHKINGLHLNDFIVAAKIDKLLEFRS